MSCRESNLFLSRALGSSWSEKPSEVMLGASCVFLDLIDNLTGPSPHLSPRQHVSIFTPVPGSPGLAWLP